MSVASAVLAAAATAPAVAQAPPAAYDLSLDTAASVSGPVVGDQDILTFMLSPPGFGLLHELRAHLPAGVGVNAITVFSDGSVVFSPDTSVTVGGATASDEDLLLWDTSSDTFSVLFDGSAIGLPGAVDIDAVSALSHSSPPELYLSLDVAAEVGGVTIDPGDILHWSQASGLTVGWSASAIFGVAAGSVSVDGLAVFDDGSLVLSVDDPVSVGSVHAIDSALLRWDGVTLSLHRRLIDDGLPALGVDIDGCDLQYGPGLYAAAFSPGVVSTIGEVAVTVTYSDADNESAQVLQVDSGVGMGWLLAQDSGCGAPLCDGDFRNGEAYLGTAFMPAGATTTLDFSGGDGRDSTVSSVSGPTFVSEPGDADGNGVRDAHDLARIINEVADSNPTASIGDVRGGLVSDSWGGTDSNGDNQIGADDSAAALPFVFATPVK